MIEKFNNAVARRSGVIYNSLLDMIKKVHMSDPILAGELAESAIELILTDQMSSDNPMIDAMLTTLKVVNDANVEKYNAKLESSRQKKKVENRLAEIAALYNQGLSQKEIGVRLGISQQAVSYRLRTIREEFAELLEEKSDRATSYKENVCTNFVQPCTKVEIGEQAEIERKKPEFYF